MKLAVQLVAGITFFYKKLGNEELER